MPEHRKLSKSEQEAVSRKLSHMAKTEGKPKSEAERKQRIAMAIAMAKRRQIGKRGAYKK